jgi:hypothetical protein
VLLENYQFFLFTTRRGPGTTTAVSPSLSLFKRDNASAIKFTGKLYIGETCLRNVLAN